MLSTHESVGDHAGLQRAQHSARGCGARAGGPARGETQRHRRVHCGLLSLCEGRKAQRSVHVICQNGLVSYRLGSTGTVPTRACVRPLQKSTSESPGGKARATNRERGWPSCTPLTNCNPRAASHNQCRVRPFGGDCALSRTTRHNLLL
jgi:hypothetical protein